MTLQQETYCGQHPKQNNSQFYGMGAVVFYNGQFIDCGGYAGVVRAFDARTGTFLWNWTAPSVGLDETSYQYTPTYLWEHYQVTGNYTSTLPSTQSTTQSDVTHSFGTST